LKNLKPHGLIFLFVLIVSSASAAQPVLPDSIRLRFAGVSQDSTYVNRLNELATSYLGTNPSVSRQISAHVLDVAQKIHFIRGYARALTVTGNSYWYEGVYEFAQNYYLLAARQYQSINDNFGLGGTYNNIGEIYKKLNEYDKALEYLLKSMELIKRDSAMRGLTLYNIGELYIRLNQVEKGRKYIQESYELALADSNKRLIAFDFWSFAAIKEKERKYIEALSYLLKAESYWKALGETRSVIQTYQDISDVYRHLNKYAEAELYLRKAIDLARRMKVPDLQVKNYLLYTSLDSIRGNFSQALAHLSRHNSLKDSVYNLLKAEQIARLQTIYETEGREQENQQLRTEKQISEAQLASQRITLITISFGLIISGILAWLLYRQQKKILFQKDAIEIQAAALLKLNEELQEFNKNLEARIGERTSQLTVQNQKLAEFTFINAHKLRAPVASILGLVNLLNQVKGDERELVVSHLKTCGEELDHVIREVSRGLEEAMVNEAHR
jgi:tetratricopeptide (TPR) repeat protein